MKFKALELRHIVDCGHDYQLKLLILNDWSMFQSSFSWSDYSCGAFLQVQIGAGRLLGVCFFAGKLGIDLDFFSRYWGSFNS